MPLYLSATDLHVEDEFPLPRFQLGSFLKALEVGVREGFGLDVEYTNYGKAGNVVYERFEQRFRETDAAVTDFWMIGDHPEVDVQGAQNAGWNSILVR